MTCVVLANGCMQCDEVPADPGRPATFEDGPILGWNAGAKSIDRLAGHLRAAWRLAPDIGGAVVGLAADQPTAPSNFSRIAHGFYHHIVAGARFAQPVEFGVQVAAAIAVAADDDYEVRRVGEEAVWMIEGDVILRRPAQLFGRCCLQAALYATGDRVI